MVIKWRLFQCERASDVRLQAQRPDGAGLWSGIEIGKTIHVLRIPPRVGSLSARAQFLFDTLTNYSPEEAEAFESGSLKKKKDAKSSDIKLGIVSAKAQLKELGVNVKWDAGKKTYVLNE